MTACPHTSIVTSDAYPRGTRCGQCGRSVESLYADARAQLEVAQALLEVAQKRVASLERCERELVVVQAQLKLEQQSSEAAGETRERLRQAETDLRNEQHYHLQTKNELQTTRKRLDESDSMLRAALNREEELKKKLETADQRLRDRSDARSRGL